METKTDQKLFPSIRVFRSGNSYKITQNDTSIFVDDLDHLAILASRIQELILNEAKLGN